MVSLRTSQGTQHCKHWTTSLDKGNVGEETPVGPESLCKNAQLLRVHWDPPQARTIQLEARTETRQPFRDQKLCETTDGICFLPIIQQNTWWQYHHNLFGTQGFGSHPPSPAFLGTSHHQAFSLIRSTSFWQLVSSSWLSISKLFTKKWASLSLSFAVSSSSSPCPSNVNFPQGSVLRTSWFSALFYLCKTSPITHCFHQW